MEKKRDRLRRMAEAVLMVCLFCAVPLRETVQMIQSITFLLSLPAFTR